MSFQYKGTENKRPEDVVLLKQIARNDRPEDYTADPELAAAVNVALMLAKPLLVTGDPGTGKTELARHVAMALGLPEPERFDTKSTSQALELFYRFDTLARFHSANIDKETRHVLDFVSWGPLGRAILLSREPADSLFAVLGISHPSMDGPGGPGAARRSVILIDEIDKAPRDFPNDLLDAIQNLRFSIKELEKGTRSQLETLLGGSADITADEKLRPVVIITSNSERNLPAPFLRRCVYYHIPFPKPEQLRTIVERRLGGLSFMNDEGLRSMPGMKEDLAKPLLRSAVSFFDRVRGLELAKPPSTAELIDWIRYLREAGATADQELAAIPDKVAGSLGLLVKSKEDLEAVKQMAAELIPPKR